MESPDSKAPLIGDSPESNKSYKLSPLDPIVLFPNPAANVPSLEPEKLAKVAKFYYDESLQREAEAFFALGTVVFLVAFHYLCYFWFIFGLNHGNYFDATILAVEALLIFTIMACCVFRKHFTKFYIVFFIFLIIIFAAFATKVAAFLIDGQIFNDNWISFFANIFACFAIGLISFVLGRARRENQHFVDFQNTRKVLDI